MATIKNYDANLGRWLVVADAAPATYKAFKAKNLESETASSKPNPSAIIDVEDHPSASDSKSSKARTPGTSPNRSSSSDASKKVQKKDLSLTADKSPAPYETTGAVERVRER